MPTLKQVLWTLLLAVATPTAAAVLAITALAWKLHEAEGGIA